MSIPIDTMALLEAKAPAALNTLGPDPEKTTDRYKFVPTLTVIDTFLKEGFNVVGASQTKAKTPYGLHQVEFEHPAMRRESLKRVGDTVLRIWLRSAHNGTCSHQLGFGLFRLVCSNGMLVQDHGPQTVRIRHIGNAPAAATLALVALMAQADEFYKTILRIKAHECSSQEERQLLEAGYEKRFGHRNIDLAEHVVLLQAHRDEDRGLDLWRTLNRIQENLIRGTVVPDNSQRQGYRTLRPVGSFTQRNVISTALIKAAAKIAA